MSRRLFSWGWPLPSDSDGFIMINKFHFHRGKGTMSAQTESKEASFQMLISEHALVWHYNLDKVIREDVDSSTTLTTAMPGTSATLRPQSWLSTAGRKNGKSQGPQWSDGKMGCDCHVMHDLCTWSSPPHPALAKLDHSASGHDALFPRSPVLRSYRWNIKYVEVILFTLSPS